MTFETLLPKLREANARISVRGAELWRVSWYRRRSLPLPWESLKYDTNLGGYRTGITEKQLQGAPKYRSDNDWSWEDRTRTRGVDDYYGVIPT